MKILIIEDELHTANRLKDLILQVRSDSDISNILQGVEEAKTWLQSQPLPDLIFQDIELNDGIAFDIYNEIDIQVPVVFTTAYSQYAIKSFQINSIEYLVKPYNRIDIDRVFKKYEKYKSSLIFPESQLLQELLHREKPIIRHRFLIKSGDNFRILRSSDIAYIIFEDGISLAIDNVGKKHILNQAISEINRELDPQQFFQVNRKCIVRADCIKSMHAWFNSRLKLKLEPASEEDIIVSRERVKDFKIWLGG